MREKGILTNIDWMLVLCYFILVGIGILNIYASIHSPEDPGFFDIRGRNMRQMFWFGISTAVAAVILFALNPRLYETAAPLIYGIVMVLLVAVIFIGANIKGSQSWFKIGDFGFQPAEISKISTSLLLAAIMGRHGFKMSDIKNFALVAAVIAVPMGIIVLQSETGSALVYIGFAFVLYREGLSGWLLFMIGMAIILFIFTLTASPYTAAMILAFTVSFCHAAYTDELKDWLKIYFPVLVILALLPFGLRRISALAGHETFADGIEPLWILAAAFAAYLAVTVYRAYRKGHSFVLTVCALLSGILLIMSTQFIFDNVLQEHQRKRIEVLLGMKEDPAGAGYNVNQSMIAIGSGGIAGKGYLNGTQTTYGFVPEQSTDFIFCTVGEEWGFLGSVAVILLYVFLISRIIRDAERSKEAFTRIYGYCVASCIFMHLFINIGMTVGIMPVIGIPLPFISYGGSSLLAFTIMLFIFVALDSHEKRYFN